MSWALYLLGNLWTLPNTLLGFLLALSLVWGWPRFEKGRRLWVCATGRGLSRWVRRRGRTATTFGFVVIIWDPALQDDGPLLDHEAVHAMQYALLGPFFLPVYLALAAFYGGGRRHPLERPAYHREDLSRSG